MLSRRLFIGSLATSLLAKNEKLLAGVFPIVQTPFTSDDKLDTKTLADEIRFLGRCGVHGVVWPQLASEYFDLTMAERLAGMEVVASTCKPLKPAVVLGVQANDTATALQYTRHAEKLAPDAIIALPPREWKDTTKILEYYKTIGQNCSRPLFAQTIGDMSVDFVLKMIDEVPNLHFIKDEAGQTLPRLSEFRKRDSKQLRGLFTGAHGRALIDEMTRGAKGTMLISQVSVYGMPGIKYMLELRGIFPNHLTRPASRNTAFDDEAKASLRQTLDFVFKEQVRL
jgi:dihydrodipicolinate synthase/N-acetylneuraminate lyase